MPAPFHRSARAMSPLAALATLCIAGFAFASGTAPPPPPPRDEAPPPSEQSSTPDPEAEAKAARAEAEKLYAKGYDQAQDAKKLDEAGKAKDAKKQFEKALKNFQGAVDRDAQYYQAWNMIGFCSRHLGDFKKAFAAYDKSLSIKPDYDEAHEYLGEAYLKTGNLDQAKAQLAWLRDHSSDEADELAEKIEAVEKKGAPATAPATAPTPAPGQQPPPTDDKSAPPPPPTSGTGSGS